MAKVVVRTSAEYTSVFLSKELSGDNNRDVQFYISELKYAESLEKGSSRTRKINSACKELNVLLGFEEAPAVVVEPKTSAKVCHYLCEHMGENAPTSRIPKRVWVDGQDDHLLDIMVPRCRYWDDDGIIEVNLYEKRAVTIPGWMNPNDYPNESISLRWFLGFGGNIDWSEAWYYKLAKLDEKTRFATIRLLNQKSFRSPKRQEIRNRIISWLDETGNVNRYDFCNIRNEFIDRECESVSHKLYWSH